MSTPPSSSPIQSGVVMKNKTKPFQHKNTDFMNKIREFENINFTPTPPQAQLHQQPLPSQSSVPQKLPRPSPQMPNPTRTQVLPSAPPTTEVQTTATHPNTSSKPPTISRSYVRSQSLPEPDQSVVFNEKGEPVSGTLDGLLDVLIGTILSTREQTNFLPEFMTVYRCFTTPSTLFDLLMDRFRAAKPEPNTNNNKERLRISTIFKHWIRTQYYDFAEDPELSAKMENSIKTDLGTVVESTWDLTKSKFNEERTKFQLQQQQQEEQLQLLIQQQQASPLSNFTSFFASNSSISLTSPSLPSLPSLSSFSSSVSPSSPPNPSPIPQLNGLSWTINMSELEEISNIQKIKPEVIAEQITLMSYQEFQQISPKEIYNYSKEQVGASSFPHLSKMITLWDKVYYWVNTEISARGIDDVKFINWILDIAQELKTHNNFDFLNSVLSGMSMFSDKLTGKLHGKYYMLIEHISSGNFWEAFSKAPSPKIPKMSGFLRSFKYSVESAKLPSKIQVGKQTHINYKKWKGFSVVIQHIQLSQLGNYGFRNIELIQEYIKTGKKKSLNVSSPSVSLNNSLNTSFGSSSISSSPPSTNTLFGRTGSNTDYVPLDQSLPKPSSKTTSASNTPNINNTNTSTPTSSTISSTSPLISNGVDQNQHEVSWIGSHPSSPPKQSRPRIGKHQKELDQLDNVSSFSSSSSDTVSTVDYERTLNSMIKNNIAIERPENNNNNNNNNNNSSNNNNEDEVLQHVVVLSQYKNTLDSLNKLVDQLKLQNQTPTQLFVFNGDQTFVIGEDGVTIGRDPSCELYYPENDLEISRFHARIEFIRGRFQFRSISARSKLFINQKLIPKNQGIPINVGDIIHLSSSQTLEVRP